MHERFIVMLPDVSVYGFYGIGDTLEEAEKHARKAGGQRGRKNWKLRSVYRFRSALPFAPLSRTANKDESDAYTTPAGVVEWLRCECERNGIAI